MAREEGAGVAVGATAQQQEVEDGQADRVAAGKGADKHLLVVIGDLE